MLLRRYIELQINELDINKRMLSRNNTELIKKLCEYLLNDDIKISYYSCAILTNLLLFPPNIERQIYSERNLENILKFFHILINNISKYNALSLILFLNITTDPDTKIYLVKNNFLELFYHFINNIINKKIIFNNSSKLTKNIK